MGASRDSKLALTSREASFEAAHLLSAGVDTIRGEVGALGTWRRVVVAVAAAAGCSTIALVQ